MWPQAWKRLRTHAFEPESLIALLLHNNISINSQDNRIDGSVMCSGIEIKKYKCFEGENHILLSVLAK